jgi:hypothetical protein
MAFDFDVSSEPNFKLESVWKDGKIKELNA